jgi:hypothetical protein
MTAQRTITLSADQWDVILEAVECHCDEGPPGEGWKSSKLSAALSSALEQPEPEGLTDRKLEELADDYMVMDGSNGTMYLEHLDFARAAIAADRALCARPSIKPVPVSERMPKLKDCDAEGRCWLGYPAFTYLVNGEHDTTNPEWDLEPLPSHEPDWPNVYWLPHWALPVPTQQGCTQLP